MGGSSVRRNFFRPLLAILASSRLLADNSDVAACSVDELAAHQYRTRTELISILVRLPRPAIDAARSEGEQGGSHVETAHPPHHAIESSRRHRTRRFAGHERS